MTTLQTLPAGYQGLSCAVTGDWVVWTQAYGITYGQFEQNWKIKALNRQTQEVRTLDEGTLPNGQVPPSMLLPYPSASHGIVVWTTFADNQGTVQAVQYNFDTKQQTVLGRNISFPLISWPWVNWGDSVRKGIVFKNLETQQMSFLPTHPTTSAFSGTSFVSSNADYSAITLIPSISPDTIGTTYIVGNGINGDFVQFPTLNDRLVTWDSNETLFAYDRKLQRLIQIDGINANPRPYISSHYFVWELPLSKEDLAGGDQGKVVHQFLYVIDTNSLP